MSPVDLGLWAVAGGLALVAGWLTLPRPPALDWERHLKQVLVTLLRGQVEAADGDAAQWLELGRRWVWYHPGARSLEHKLTDPAGFEIPVPAEPGERGLVEALAQLDGIEARLERTFQSEQGPDEVLYEDPEMLGSDYDPVAVLGPEAGWDAVAAWSAQAAEGVKRRQEGVRWVLVGEDFGLAEAIAAELGEGAVHRAVAQEPEALEEELTALVPGLSERLVVIAFGEGAALAARTLHSSPRLRDRVRAVLGVGAMLGGETAEWLAERFDHDSMDTELHRAVPWFHLAFVSPGVEPVGELGRPLAETRWPRPPDSATGRRAVDAIDLGVLPGPRDAYPAQLLARALLLTVTARLVLHG